MGVGDGLAFFQLPDDFGFEPGILFDLLLDDRVQLGGLVHEFVVAVSVVFELGGLAVVALLVAHCYMYALRIKLLRSAIPLLPLLPQKWTACMAVLGMASMPGWTEEYGVDGDLLFVLFVMGKTDASGWPANVVFEPFAGNKSDGE